MAEDNPDWQETKPLGTITCSSYNCEQDLHCFRQKRPRDKSYRNGRCVACNVSLIDWERLDRHAISDSGYTVNALKNEYIRHSYWHKTVDERAINHARRKGLVLLSEAVIKRLEKYLRPPSAAIFRDGTQTPLSGNIIYYAQHATATCCRKCAEEWHGIDRKRALTTEELGYMADLIMLYIKERLPGLTTDGEKVPALRTGK